MANPFYNASGAPATSSFGASASIRAEFDSIAAGFAKLPSTLTANKAVIVNPGATALTLSTGSLTLNGNLSVATGKTVTLSNTLTFTGTDGSSVNFGAGGTVVFGVSGTANEISVSTLSGTATVSLPTALTFTGKTVTGGTFASPTLSGTVAGAHSYSGAITSSSTIAATSFNSTTSAYQLNGNNALVQAGNYTINYTSNGVPFIQAGNATDPQNYYNNDGHVFRNAAQSSTYASIVATGTTLTGTLTAAAANFSGAVSVNSGAAGLNSTFNSTNASGVYTQYQNSGVTVAYLGTAKQTISGGLSAADFALSATGVVYLNGTNLEMFVSGAEVGRWTSTGLNNANIGATTPGTGAFTTVSNTGETITSTSATALTVGRQGSTNPVLQIDASTASVVTGIKVTGAAAAGGVAISAISSGANEGISFDGKGSGDINIGGVSSGFVKIGAATGQGVLIGIATTTVGAIANSIPTLVGTISTFNGSVGGLSLNTWVTACTLPNGSIWEVSCFASVGAAGYSASGVAVNDTGSGAMAQGGVGPSMQIQMSGTSLQIRQTASGGTLTGYFTLKRVW